MSDDPTPDTAEALAKALKEAGLYVTRRGECLTHRKAARIVLGLVQAKQEESQ